MSDSQELPAPLGLPLGRSPTLDLLLPTVLLGSRQAQLLLGGRRQSILHGGWRCGWETRVLFLVLEISTFGRRSKEETQKKGGTAEGMEGHLSYCTFSVPGMSTSAVDTPAPRRGGCPRAPVRGAERGGCCIAMAVVLAPGLQEGAVMPYAIVFDLDTKLLEVSYHDIEKTLAKYGFQQQQGSVYFGNEKVDAVTCVLAIMELATLPWFAPCVSDIRMLRIEELNDLMPAVERAAPNRVKLKAEASAKAAAKAAAKASNN